MRFICAVLATNLAVIFPAMAQIPEYPSTGVVYNTKDAAALTHFCRLSSDRATMDCEFTQTSVRRKSKTEEAAKKLADARTQFASKPEQVGEKNCAEYENLSMIMQGRKPAPDPQGLANMGQRAKADMTAMIGHIVSYCRVPSLDNWIKFVSAGLDKDKRTCLLSSHTFKQKFRQTDTGSWIVVAQPEGPCGVVQLSRFEPEKSSTITFWNYIARKAVTNPNGNAVLMQCKDLDEGEYKYQWQKRDPDLNCEYVEFSPI